MSHHLASIAIGWHDLLGGGQSVDRSNLAICAPHCTYPSRPQTRVPHGELVCNCNRTCPTHVSSLGKHRYRVARLAWWWSVGRQVQFGHMRTPLHVPIPTSNSRSTRWTCLQLQSNLSHVSSLGKHRYRVARLAWWWSVGRQVQFGHMRTPFHVPIPTSNSQTTRWTCLQLQSNLSNTCLITWQASLSGGTTCLVVVSRSTGPIWPYAHPISRTDPDLKLANHTVNLSAIAIELVQHMSHHLASIAIGWHDLLGGGQSVDRSNLAICAPHCTYPSRPQTRVPHGELVCDCNRTCPTHVSSLGKHRYRVARLAWWWSVGRQVQFGHMRTPLHVPIPTSNSRSTRWTCLQLQSNLSNTCLITWQASLSGGTTCLVVVSRSTGPIWPMRTPFHVPIPTSNSRSTRWTCLQLQSNLSNTCLITLASIAIGWHDLLGGGQSVDRSNLAICTPHFTYPSRPQTRKPHGELVCDCNRTCPTHVSSLGKHRYRVARLAWWWSVGRQVQFGQMRTPLHVPIPTSNSRSTRWTCLQLQSNLSNTCLITWQASLSGGTTCLVVVSRSTGPIWPICAPHFTYPPDLKLAFHTVNLSAIAIELVQHMSHHLAIVWKSTRSRSGHELMRYVWFWQCTIWVLYL